MSKSNTTELDFLQYTFNATSFSWNAVGNLYIALHTADPGEAGTQSTSEATYTSYARVAVARTSSGWTASANPAVNLAQITMPQCTGGSNTITHVSIGIASSGATQILYSGVLNSSLSVSNLIQPIFAASALSISED